MRSVDHPAAARSTDNATVGMDRRRFGTTLVAALAGAAALPQAGHALTEPLGTSARWIDLDWTDDARGRAVPVRLYWPSAPARPVPLVVFSHGLGGSRRGYQYLAEHWTARGYASLHVQHVGSDNAIWLGDPFTFVSRLRQAADLGEALNRALDVSFALDRILDRARGPVGAAIDGRRIVAAGHSYGANTVLVLAGAQVRREGRIVGGRDPRIGAGIAISAPAFYGEQDLRAVLGGIRAPTLHVTATGDEIRLPGYGSSVADRYAVFEAVGAPDKLLAVFEGGSHSMFTDRPLTGGLHLNPQVKAATAALSLAFLDLAFRGDRRPISNWTAAWRPILAFPPRLAPTAFAAPIANRRGAMREG